MNNFVQGDNFEGPGGEAEKLVWEKVKDGFRNRECIAYSKYPLFSNIGESRKEPDILIIDKEFGIVVIEVKGISIEQIGKVEGCKWTLKNFYQKSANPIGQAQSQLFALMSRLYHPDIYGKLNTKVLVALPFIYKEQWKSKNFGLAGEMPIIFSDNLSPAALKKTIEEAGNVFTADALKDNQWKTLLSCIGGENVFVKETEVDFSENTKAYICKAVDEEMYDLDMQQENIGKVIPPGPQRIRGIAGSGKTLLLCQKAAYMHLKYPDYKIALVFFTRSLYDNIRSNVDRYIRMFSAGSLKYEPSGNLKILHAWGGSDLTGLYREIAMNNGISPLNVKDVKRLKVGKSLGPAEGLLFACKKLLEDKGENINQIYDAVLIDEGQDLVGEDWLKYNGTQAFYYMAYKALKPIDTSKPKLKRLIWAYDELQNLNSKKVPTNKEIFGDDAEIREITSGVYYEGGIKKSEIMKVCYRTPHLILTTAHAIGMGLFRQEGMVCGYTKQNDWEDIGYKVTAGDFKGKGNIIRLERPIENSPNPINKHFSGDLISFETFTNDEDLYEELANNIKEDIEKQELNPKKQIVIVYIGYKSIRTRIAKAMNKAGLNYYVPQAPGNNVTEFHWKDKEGDKFWSDDAVTIASIYEAKGNEANMVYVLGIENVAQKEGDINTRNELFVALTRARCWVKVMGLGEYRFYEEFRKAIEAKGNFEFVFKKPGQVVDDLENE
jgi:superfamily I DNA and RNA helicase